MSSIAEIPAHEPELEVRATNELDLIDYLLIFLALGVLLFGAMAIFGSHISAKTHSPVSAVSNP